uniref:L1 transposable element RRM domain-containing protein n=1 Tax=Equus caballus TaxID=9796 RepID=A0A9L0RLG5_HORSE
MRRQRNTLQAREQDKTPEKEVNETEISTLPDKEFKQKLVRMLTDLGRRLDEHSENINKELENIKKNPSEIKSRVINSRVAVTVEQISELEERLEEITQAEEIKEKRIRQNDNSLRELWDNIKHANICIIGVPEGQERDKGAKNLFEEIIAENFPNIRKETDIQVQEAQRAPNKMNANRTTLRHTIIKMSKIKGKGIILKVMRERQQVIEKGKSIRLSANFSAETLKARREQHDISKVLKGKNLQPRILYPARNARRDKKLPRQKEFITEKLILQEILKGLI